ncbi:MAG: methyltransferase domain-containing protein [Acidobacteria bacterium]|nr:methyltransferase domain-containing protein [Acidobacteriota bacterium]
MKSFTESLPHTGEGIVIDIGTGDGRFVSAAAKANPNKFFIGVDANVRPLEKPSMKATRKPAKGGLPNAMFVQAAVEDLPDEFDGVADEIHIHFPWGSLLKAVATGDEAVLRSLHRIAAPGCLLEVIIGIDPVRDRTELDRLDMPELTSVVMHSYLIPKYISAGFEFVETKQLGPDQWVTLETSWARKLQGGAGRTVTLLLFKASG